MPGSEEEHMKGRIIIYSISGCPHCLRAKSTLTSHDLPYTDVSLDLYDSSVRKELQARTGVYTVPQIFFNEIYVGGNAELQKAVGNSYQWKSLLQALHENAPGDGAPEPPPPELMDADDKHKSLGNVVCEQDEYVRLVKQLKKSHIIKDHRVGLTLHKKSFKGRELIDWLTQTQKIDYYAAVEMGRMLVSQHFGQDVSKGNKDNEGEFSMDSYYRLLEDTDDCALNSGGASDCATRPASQLGEELRQRLLHLYAKHLSKDGSRVDYASLKDDGDFEQYEQLARQLQRAQVTKLDRDATVAFFINVYNALVIHGTVVMGKPGNLWQRYKFFNTVCYVIAGENYNLQDIENGVLRGNKRGLGALSKQFGKNDTRHKVSVDGGEPLIHFALNCGARSCPPIKTFTAGNIKSELAEATKAFLEMDDNVSVDLESWSVKLSKIFKWYQVDFGADHTEVLQFVHEHMAPGAKRDAIRKCIDYGATVGYLPYDWGSNDKKK